MNREDIIRMAREAGMDINSEASDWGEIIIAEPADLERFFQAAYAAGAAAEREALLETVYSYARSLSWNEDFQADVRARGQE